MCNIKSCGKNTLGDIFFGFLDCNMKYVSTYIQVYMYSRENLWQKTQKRKNEKYKKKINVVGVDCWCLPLLLLCYKL